MPVIDCNPKAQTCSPAHVNMMSCAGIDTCQYRLMVQTITTAYPLADAALLHPCSLSLIQSKGHALWLARNTSNWVLRQPSAAVFTCSCVCCADAAVEGFSNQLQQPIAFAAVDSIVRDEQGQLKFHYVVVEVGSRDIRQQAAQQHSVSSAESTTCQHVGACSDRAQCAV